MYIPLITLVYSSEMSVWLNFRELHHSSSVFQLEPLQTTSIFQLIRLSVREPRLVEPSRRGFPPFRFYPPVPLRVRFSFPHHGCLNYSILCLPTLRITFLWGCWMTSVHLLPDCVQSDVVRNSTAGAISSTPNRSVCVGTWDGGSAWETDLTL
jgi:hypothetical protein